MSENSNSFTPTPYDPSAPAHFTPTQGNYRELKPFRFWCQKVLPLVYDDSLSYYELLCKVVDYLNKTMEDVDTLHTDVDNLHTAYEELQGDYNTKYAGMTEWINQSYQALVDFVNTYFEELDVQEEINNKLDTMALDGSLSALLAPFIPDLVTTWLNEHVDPIGSAVVVDNTLSISGAAADAKVTGDRITNTDIKAMAESNKQALIRSRQSWAEFYSSNEDLTDVTDENGNIGLIVKRFGSLKTKKFDSDDTEGLGGFFTNDSYDFGIVDNNGNICFGVKNGFILPHKLYNKKVSIIGDSISSYSGSSVSGYPTFYPTGNVDSINKMWWYKLFENTGLKLLKNASWSGSTVTGDSQGETAFAGCSDVRVNDVKDGTILPDIIIIFMGTNDWSENVELGDYEASEAIPNEGVISNFSKAYALLLYKLRNNYPNAQIMCATILPRHGRITNRYPIANNSDKTIMDFNDKIRKIANIFDCPIIDTEKSTITFWNIANNAVDNYLHPNANGMTLISKRANIDVVNNII